MALECMDSYKEDCKGPVDYRMNLTGTGLQTVRCDKHWEDRLNLQDDINQRYPYHAPSDFDPTYAGEHWGDEY